MPPQKNSGNKGSKKSQGISTKNKRFVQAFLSDARVDGDVEDVYVSRVLRKLGNGRMDVFFVRSDGRSHTTQASIRGTFRGKAKYSVYIDVGSIVMVGDTGVPGPCQYEIMAVLSSDDIRSIRKEMEIDSRIFAVEVTDVETLKKSFDVGEGFVFEDDAPKEDGLFEESSHAPKDDDVDIDDI